MDAAGLVFTILAFFVSVIVGRKQLANAGLGLKNAFVRLFFREATPVEAKAVSLKSRNTPLERKVSTYKDYRESESPLKGNGIGRCPYCNWGYVVRLKDGDGRLYCSDNCGFGIFEDGTLAPGIMVPGPR
jgi:hypothetical protein